MKETYLGLLNNEWRMNDIDEMDIYYYLELLSYEENKKYKQNVENILSIL